MSRITEALLKEKLPKDVKIEGHHDGWKVTFPCKVVAEFGKDFLGPIKRKKVPYKEFEQAVLACCHLANEVFGGIGIYGGASKNDTKAFITWCQSHGFKVHEEPGRGFSADQVTQYFGDGATLEKKRRGSRISLPDGSGVFIKHQRIERVWGETYDAALRMMNENNEFVIVGGSRDNVVMGLARGTALGIEVIPELHLSEKVYTCIGGAAGAICFFPGIAVGTAYGNMLYGLFGALVASIILSAIICLLFVRDSVAKARERGQALKTGETNNIRRSTAADARALGMLL
jgi:hypothetical protein